MKKLIMSVCVLAIALTAVPAFAAVQNVRVSGWTDNTFIHRQNFDLGRVGGGTDEQSLFINQTGLQVDADLTDQVFVTIALISERGWSNDGNNSSTTEMDLHLAYVTLKEMLYSPLTLIVGRQVFSFGNSLVFDATGTNNVAPGDSGISAIADDLTKQTAVDAIRAVLDYNPLTITAFYSKLDQNTTTLSDLDDDVEIWGLNANYQLGDDMDSVVEAYFFKHRDKSGNTDGTGAQTDYIKLTGVRASTNPIEGLNLQAEVAHQGGKTRAPSGDRRQNRNRDAWAAQFIANYQIPAYEEYNPVAQYVYTKVTGDTHTDDNLTDHTGWDPFFENQGGGHIYNALFNLTNMHIHSLYLTFNPLEDVTARLAATAIWLDRELKGNFAVVGGPDGLLAAQAGGVAQSYDVNPDNDFLGKELNLDLTYDYTEDVQIGTSLGYFWAGSVFNNDNDSTAKQLLVNMNVAF